MLSPTLCGATPATQSLRGLGRRGYRYGMFAHQAVRYACAITDRDLTADERREVIEGWVDERKEVVSC